MLDPLTALGLTANVIQICDFAHRTFSYGKEAYNSTNGALVRHIELKAVASRFNDLSRDITRLLDERSWSMEEQGDGNEVSIKPEKPATESHQQLLDLVTAAKRISSQLVGHLESLKFVERAGWKSVRVAILSVIKESKLNKLETSLSKIRDEIQTNLLITMRQSLTELQKENQENGRETRKLLERLLAGAHQTGEGGSDIGSHLQSSDPKTWLLFTQTLLAGQIRNVEMITRQRHIDVIMQLLSFGALPIRQEAISPAHKHTFEWAFYGKLDPAAVNCARFSDWLRSDQKVYWIGGKPGAGKSTLMKFLYQEDRTRALAQSWANAGQSNSITLHIAAYYFWIAGTKLQKSKEGLVRTLIVQLARPRSEIIPEIFPDRMKRCEIWGADPTDLPMSEAIQALMSLLSRTDRRFLLFIDGLDEFDGQSEDIIDFMQTLSQYESVKICVSSRPWNAFVDAFSSTPKLQVEQLTREDIGTYIDVKFATSALFRQLQKFRPSEADELKEEIAAKAQGVFLWVYVVVESLLQGLRDGDGDDLPFLRARLDALPAELEALFDRIFKDIDPAYAKQASEIFHFLKIYPEEATLLGLHLALTPIHTAIIRDTFEMNKDEAEYHMQTIRRRIYSRCKCFLECPENGQPMSRVNYLHRTARDYLRAPDIWKRIQALSSEEHIYQAAIASRLMLSRLRPTRQSGYSPVSKEQSRFALANMTYDVRAVAAVDMDQRIEILETVDWLGQQSGRRTWVAGLPDTKMEADLMSQKSERFGHGRRFSGLLDVAACADWDFYLNYRLSKQSSSRLNPSGDFKKNIALAAVYDSLASQEFLLSIGAKPMNCGWFEISAWEAFLWHRLNWTNTDTEHSARILKVFVAYLEQGAEPNIKVTYVDENLRHDPSTPGSTHQTYSVEQVITIFLESSTIPWDAEESRSLWSAYRKAKSRKAKAKGKKMLQAPYRQLENLLRS